MGLVGQGDLWGENSGGEGRAEPWWCGPDWGFSLGCHAGAWLKLIAEAATSMTALAHGLSAGPTPATAPGSFLLEILIDFDN